MTVVWALLPFAYLLGTFPSAVIIARSRGVDITAVGSRNPGASNVGRTLGTGWGILVFVLDGLKGAVPAAVGLALDRPAAAYALVAAAALGHMYPVTRRFAGGKGVATVGGGVVVLHPVVFAVLLVVWVAIRTATGTASIGSLTIAVGFPVGVALAGGPGWEIAAAAGLAVLVLARHTGNIRRLLSGNELSASRSRHQHSVQGGQRRP